MDVTPTTTTGLRVSLGDGAKLVKRDSSSQDEVNKKTPDEQPLKRETPIDLAAVKLADALKLANPLMDAKAASELAKQLLARTESPEATNAESDEPTHQLDVRL
jgi:hypothetical protein